MLRDEVTEKVRAEVAGLNAVGANAATVDRLAAAKMAENFMVLVYWIGVD